MKNKPYPKIGLALGSGGLRGIASHIGVIKELVRAKIPIDYISGSSAGSLIGGIYATTKNIKDLEKKFLEYKSKDYLYWVSDITLTSGLIKGDKIIEFIEKFVGKNTISKCKIPFTAVTTNLDTGRTVVISKGSTAEAIRSSCSIPILFQPRKFGKRWLIDGGASEAVPVKTVKKMGADIVIGVNMNSHLERMPRKKSGETYSFSKIELFDRTMGIILSNLAKLNCQYADIVISPNLAGMGWLNMGEYIGSEKPIKIGEEATKKAIPHIKEKIDKWIEINQNKE